MALGIGAVVVSTFDFFAGPKFRPLRAGSIVCSISNFILCSKLIRVKINFAFDIWSHYLFLKHWKLYTNKKMLIETINHFFRCFHFLRVERDCSGHALRDRERVGEELGGSRYRLAHPHGVALHHGSLVLRDENSRKVFPWKAGYLGTIVVEFY